MENKSKNTPQKIAPIQRGGPMGMMGSGAKAKNFKKSMKQLIKYLKPYYIIISISLILAFAGTIFAVVGPEISKKIGEEILSATFLGISINLQKIVQFAIWLLILYIASTLFNIVQGFFMAKITARITKNFRTDITKKINKLPLKYFDTNSNGDTLSRITNDVDTISQTLNQSLSSIITSITMVIGSLVMMLINSWQLTLVAIVIAPLSMFLVMTIVKFSQKYFKKQQKSLGELNGHIEETYSAYNIVKVFNGEQNAEDKFNKVNDELYKSSYKSQFFSGLMMPLMNFVGNIGYVLIVFVGAILSLKNPTFAATIVAFITYVRMFNNQISQMATIANTLQSTAAASERVFEFLEEKEVEDESNKVAVIPSINGKVEFKNIGFGYYSDKNVIHDFSCVAKPGQKVAIVGPTGAGKTTLVNLLMKFYNVQEGDILIDGVSIHDMKSSEVRKLFGMVLQDTWLFEGTIRENIGFGTKDKTKDKIESACCFAHIDHFIRSLPNGYDMMIDETANISQGQKQLITIARAMVHNNPMLILDEATSSVDTRTEIIIQKAMDKLMQGRTSFVIAHRLSTIKNADLILVLKDGNIVEQGKHKELLEKNGFYSELYNSQFENS